MSGKTFNGPVQWLAIPCAVSWSKKSKVARKMTEGYMQCISSKVALRKGFRHLSVRLVAFPEVNCSGSSAACASSSRFLPR